MMCLILDLHSLPQFVTVSLTCSVTSALLSNKLLATSKTGNIITYAKKKETNSKIFIRFPFQIQILKIIIINDNVKSAL